MQVNTRTVRVSIGRYTHKLWMTGCWLGRDVPS
jgi:hypothetical protein